MESLDTTEFNSNLATLDRVDKLLRYSHSARSNGQLREWFKNLEGLMIEARYKMKKSKELKEELDDLYSDLYNTNILYETNKGNNFTLKGIFSKKLLFFQNFLMDFLGAKGMLLRDKDDRGL